VSGRALTEKLGVKAGTTLAVVGAPTSFGDLAANAVDDPQRADTLIFFVSDRVGATGAIVAGLAAFMPGKRLWFACPKKSGAFASDISRDHGWEALQDAGFLPVTQIALDADWSALRFRPRGEIAKLTRASEAPR
jgi:hypothetical protein